MSTPAATSTRPTAAAATSTRPTPALSDDGALLPAPAQLTRGQYEYWRSVAPFPPRLPNGQFRLGHPKGASGLTAQMPRGALLPHIRMYFYCGGCGDMWHIDDLDGRTTRIVPCPECGTECRAHVAQYCMQAYRGMAAYEAAIERIKYETEMWNSVDVLEQKKAYSPYEAMARRRTHSMREAERELRRG